MGTFSSLASSFMPRESALTSWLRFSKRPRAGHQLQVVHNHQAELALLLQAAQLGVHVHQVHAGGVVDVERRFHQLDAARG